jgi:hypothetical protein
MENGVTNLTALILGLKLMPKVRPSSKSPRIGGFRGPAIATTTDRLSINSIKVAERSPKKAIAHHSIRLSIQTKSAQAPGS